VLANLADKWLAWVRTNWELNRCPVEALSTDVTGFRPGDEVFAEIREGGFAEYAGVSEDQQLDVRPDEEGCAAVAKIAERARRVKPAHIPASRARAEAKAN